MVGLAGTEPPGKPPFGAGNVYLLHNGKARRKPHAPSLSIFQLAENGLGTMLSSSWESVLMRASLAAQDRGYDFHVAAIPMDVDVGSSILAFDQDQMCVGFEAGYRLGKTSARWEAGHPHLEDFPDWLMESAQRQ